MRHFWAKAAGFEDIERGHKPKNTGAFQAENKLQKTASEETGSSFLQLYGTELC